MRAAVGADEEFDRAFDDLLGGGAEGRTFARQAAPGTAPRLPRKRTTSAALAITDHTGRRIALVGSTWTKFWLTETNTIATHHRCHAAVQ